MTPGRQRRVDRSGGPSGGGEPVGGDSPPLLALRSLQGQPGSRDGIQPEVVIQQQQVSQLGLVLIGWALVPLCHALCQVDCSVF